MRHCTICGKGSVIRGKRRLLRGHYNPVSWARKYPNLQWARLPSPPPDSLRASKRAGAAQSAGGQASVRGVRKLICTSCMKTLHKTTKKAEK